VTLRYFAYGANLHPARMRERAPSSRVVGTAVLEHHALRFHKRSRDGSAKCDVVPERGARVHGVLYEVALQDFPQLDTAESGYERVRVNVVVADGTVDAVTYRARPDAIAPDLLPFCWYRALVVLGARHHRLPAAYVDAIEKGPACDDPDPERSREMEVLVDTRDRID
jgi:hypothetical protein